MYFTMKDFKERNIAVSFKNGWEQKRFLKECEKERLKWFSGSKATDFMFPVDKCITYGYSDSDRLEFCKKEFYESEGWQVVKFNQILFGNWKEIKRKANVGDYIKLTHKSYSFDKEGDILKIDGLKGCNPYVLGENHLRYTKHPNYDWTYIEEEYVVLEREEKGEDIMKKNDLKNGTIVELRNGDKYILLLNTYYSNEKDDYLISLRNGGYIEFDDYDKNLESKDGEKEYDIMKVCQSIYVGDNFRNHVINDRDKWTWKRQEEVVMTIGEIEEKLGINGLKIKKED